MMSDSNFGTDTKFHFMCVLYKNYMSVLPLLLYMVLFGLSRSFLTRSSASSVCKSVKHLSIDKKASFFRHRYTRDGPSSQAPATPQPALAPGETKRVKRKVALVFGYVGTQYNGLQMDAQQLAQGLVAVEAVIERELHQLKFIKDSNHLDLDKISWSRSSRTDKGVHCARIVLSAKIEFDPSDVPGDDEPPFFRSITESMNERLPADIRMISCFRVSGSFRARDNCVWREYEYLLPVSAILSYSNADATGTRHKDTELKLTKEQFIARMNKFLRRLEGDNSLHNFHRAARRDLKSRRPQVATHSPEDTGAADAASDLDSEGTSVDSGADVDANSSDPLQEDLFKGIESASTQSSAADESTPTPDDRASEEGVIAKQDGRFMSLFERWYPMARDIIPKTRGVIFVCEATGLVTVDGQEFLRIAVRGQSFLLHQIRIIIGTAIYCATGRLPEEVVEAALVLPYHVPLPMAPAEGLILVNSGYFLKPNPQSCPLISYKCPSGVAPIGTALLSESQIAASEQFKADFIYPQIARDWRGEQLVHDWFQTNDPQYVFHPKVPIQLVETKNDESRVLNKGASLAGNYSMALWKGNDDLLKIYETLPTTSTAFWTALCAADPTVAKNVQQEISRMESDVGRRHRFLAILNGDWPPAATSESTEKPVVKNPKMRPLTYQDLLPTGMYTALTVFARIPPGAEISAGCLGIVSMIARGEVPVQWSPAQILAHVEPLGGLAYLIRQPVDPRFSQ